MATLTAEQLRDRILGRLRLPTTDTTNAARVLAWMNDVYRDIGMKYDWWWLDKRTVVTTADDITAGTVSVTQNSTAITFSSAPTSSVAARWLYVPSNATDASAMFRISAHTGGAAAATLASVYTGATSTAAGYNVWQDTYALPADFGKPKFILRYGYRQSLEETGADDLFRIKAYDRSVGPPQRYTILDFGTTGDPTTQRQLIVHPFPDALYTLEVHYKQALNTEMSGTTRPLIPDDYTQVLVHGTLAMAFPTIHNDVERGTYYERKFLDALALMMAAQREKTSGNPRLVIEDQYRRFYTRGRRISPGTADLGDTFNRWPMET